MKIRTLVAIAATTAALLACSKHDDSSTTATEQKAETSALPPASEANASVSISKVTLGNAISADKHVLAENSIFHTKDTIYAVVETTGSGKATLKAKWSFVKDGDLKDVDETTQDIEATGPAATEFHIAKDNGWPTGTYKVEVWIDDKSNGVKEFTVQ